MAGSYSPDFSKIRGIILQHTLATDSIAEQGNEGKV
jgi:hypothetical protein